jgi:hypothetical protein
MYLLILVVVVLSASCVVAETTGAKNAKLFSRPRLGPGHAMQGTSSSDAAAMVVETQKKVVHIDRTESDESYGVLESFKDEIMYIGEGFVDSRSKEEMMEHASEVFDRHRGLIGGVALVTMVGMNMSPNKQGGVRVAKNSASSLRAAEIAKWGTRKA